MLTHHAIGSPAHAAHYFSPQDDYYTREGAASGWAEAPKSSG